MPRKRERLFAALSAAGAVLKRSKKHLVYELPNGKTFTTSASPSDAYAEKNALGDLKRALGEQPHVAVVNAPRVKKQKPGRSEKPDFHIPMSPLAEALKSSGVKDSAELAKARETERELRWKIDRLELEARTAQRHIDSLESLRVVRIYRALGGKL